MQTMKLHCLLPAILALVASLATTLHAQTPNLVSYQGRIAVGTVNFEGTGQFRFALVNAAGTTVYWGNAADTTPADGVPDTPVSLPVSKGLYSVLLGDTDVANMATIPVSVWANPDVRLRVWFNDGVNGNQLLTPDQRLAPTGYVADGSVGSAAIADNAITSAKINNGAVGNGKISNGAVTSAKLANNAVQAVNIANGTITSAKLDSNIVVSGSNYGLGHKLGLQEFGTYIDVEGVWIGSKSNDPVHLYTNDSAYPNITLATDLNVGLSAYEPIVSLTHPNSTLPGQKIYDATTRGLHVDGGDKGVIAIESDNRATLHLRSNNAGNDRREFVIRHDSSGQVNFAYPFGLGINQASVMKLDLFDVTLFENSAGTLRVGSNGNGFVTVQNRLSVDEAQQTPASGYYGVSFGGSTSGEFIASNRTAGSTNRYGLDLYTASQPRLSITASGSVGIGTSNPTQAKLVVSGNGGTTLPSGTYGYLTPSGASGNNASNSVGLSIYAAEGVWTSGNFYASSDARIKTIAGVSDGSRDLATLRSIEITDYQYKDSVNKGQARQKKVIAQQVEKVFPQAVIQQTDVVPDIFQKATFKDGWIHLKTNLKKGERVRLTDDKSAGVHEVLAVKDDGFRTSFQPAGGEVFVYGREVKDFRVVDYEAIAMLNVSATQELARKVQAKDTELAKLTAENAALKKQLAVNEARDKAVEARLAAIEKAAAAQPVKVALTK